MMEQSKGTSWASNFQKRPKIQVRSPSSGFGGGREGREGGEGPGGMAPIQEELPAIVSPDEWEFSKGVAEATRSISRQTSKLVKRASSWNQGRAASSEKDDEIILEFEKKLKSKKDGERSPEMQRSESTQSLHDDFAFLEIVKIVASKPREGKEEKNKRVQVKSTTTAAMVVAEVLSKCNIEDPPETFCLLAIDHHGNEISVADDEGPLIFHPDFYEPGSLDRHLSFVVRKKHRMGLENTNEMLFKQIMDNEGGNSFDFSRDSFPGQSEWPQNLPEKKKNKKATELFLEEIMEETLLVLGEQIEDYQHKLFSETEPQESHFYKEMLSKVLQSFEEIVRQANVTLKRFQALQKKDLPLVIATKGFNVESLPAEDEKRKRNSGHNSPSKEKGEKGEGKERKKHSRSDSVKSARSISEIKEEEDKDKDKEKEKEKEKGEGEGLINEEEEPYLHKLNNALPYKSHFWDLSTDKPIAGQLNFLGDDPKLGPLCVTILREKDKSRFGRYRVLIWTKEGCYTRFVPAQSGGTLRGEILAELIANKVSPQSHLSSIPDQDLCLALLKMEADQSEKGYKFGVVYVKEGQTREDDMFGNRDGSPAFEEFLGLLGDKVRLLDWKKFRGGLDVTMDTTGTHSIYRKWKDMEIMFHVSTLLPYETSNAQQLGRKRHIGNDICLILFVDGKTPYLPDTITSRFNHVFIVVRPNSDNTYSVEVAAKDTVPHFGPRITLRKYPRNQAFILFLLAKLINGQHAAYRAPAFQEKLRRTREFLINDLMSKFLNSGPMASQRKIAAMAEPTKSKPKSSTVSKKGGAEMAATVNQSTSPSTSPLKVGTFRIPKFRKNFPLIASASIGTKMNNLEQTGEESDEEVATPPPNFFNSPQFYERRESAPVRTYDPPPF